MPMIIRSATPKIGKVEQALEFAKKAAAYLNENFNTAYQVFTQGFGDKPVGTIYWINQYDSLAEWEALQALTGSDPGYSEMYATGIELFTSGTIIDQVLWGPQNREEIERNKNK